MNLLRYIIELIRAERAQRRTVHAQMSIAPDSTSTHVIAVTKVVRWTRPGDCQ